jgi:predicted Zn-dependent protease
MSTEEKYELFDAYLENSLNPEEQKSFEALLLDNSFKKEFDEYCQIQNAYISIIKNEKSENDFKQNLKSIAQNYIASKTTNDTNETLADYVKAQEAKRNQFKTHKKINPFSITRNIKLGFAAAALIVLSVMVAPKLFAPKQDMQSLFAKNYEPEKISVERGANIDSVYTIATLFNAKKYAETKPILNSYLTTHPTDYRLKLVLAMCELEQNNYTSTETILQNIIADNNVHKEKAQWYLAMTYLKQDKKDKVCDLLHSFGTDHFYFNKGQEILKTIK